ncbi:MAG: DUF2946 family protein [Pirellulales bacterium]|nr:DUF2946 family protein [Pirellulales bacterium]
MFTRLSKSLGWCALLAFALTSLMGHALHDHHGDGHAHAAAESHDDSGAHSLCGSGCLGHGGHSQETAAEDSESGDEKAPHSHDCSVCRFLALAKTQPTVISLTVVEQLSLSQVPLADQGVYQRLDFSPYAPRGPPVV